MISRRVSTITFVATLACAASLTVRQVHAQQSAPKRLPSAALISSDENVITSLFEAKLLESNQATWLERNEINRLLEEQKLDAAFGAAGGKDRLSLGKLLKADLLVLVRTVDSPENKDEKLLECVVCETEQGLRLRVTHVPVDKDAEETVRTLAAAFDAALQKYGQSIREIVAVSPLVSDDLSFKYNYLQTAYAKLIEQKLLDQPGVAVVELGEAQAIGRELVLSPDGKGVARRSQPLFVLGNFRHSEEKRKTTVALELRLLRGEKQIAAAHEPALATSKATAWLQSSTMDLLRAAKVGAALSTKSDAAAEAKQLAARANEFFHIGNWEEALALLEASLLLQPDQEQAHHDAVVACGKLMPGQKLHGETRPEPVHKAVSLYLRGLDHLEAFLRTAESAEKYKVHGQVSMVFALEVGTNAWGLHPDAPAELRSIIADMRVTRRDAYLRIARNRAKNGFADEDWLVLALQGMPLQERLDLTARLIEEFKDYPDGKQRAVHLVLDLTPHRKTPEFQAFLGGLANATSRQIREAHAEARDTIAELEKQIDEEKRKMPSRETDIAKEITLAPVTMRVAGQGDVPLIYGCVPAGKSNDVFWSHSAIFLMRERGMLKELWKSQDRSAVVNTAIFDGRYIWAVIQRHLRPPQLLVVDPANVESSMFSATDGLPGDDVEQPPSTPADRLAICALEPGRIFVAGSVGRGWLGFAAYDGKKKSIRIFHEAREAAVFSDPKQGEKTTIAFRPSYAVAWPPDSDTGGGRTVLAGRYCDNPAVARYPLLINVKAESVLSASFQLTGYSEHNPTDRAFMTVLGDKVLFAAYNPKLEMPEMLCASAPGLPPEPIYLNPPDGLYFAGEGEVHILGKKWWIFDPKRKTLRVAANPVPWKFNSRWSRQGKVDAAEIRGPYDLQLHGVHHSNHYGMLAIVADTSSKREIIQAVRAQPASIRKP